MNERFKHLLPFGADLRDDGHTAFRLWAPDATKVLLMLEEDAAALPMQRADDGWHTLTHRCGAGTRYRYVLEDGSQAPDPASRWQPDGVSGASVVLDPRAYRWRHGEWRGRSWNETVLYELHVGTFGGYDGVRTQLSRLAELGITAIELMPIAQFPGTRNWGYDGVLPFAPAYAYGTPDALKALIDEAHGLGLSVFLDVVYNHFGPEGNYLSKYASPFFRHDVDTPWGAAIDYRRHEVREFFIHNALMWLLEYRFDGLRLDAVHAIVGRDWLIELADRVDDAVEPGRFVHLVLENDDNDAGLLESCYAAQWNDDAHHTLHVALTGEREGYYGDYADPPAPDLARWLAEGFVYQGQPSPHRDNAPRGEPSMQLPPSAFVTFLQNHDQIGNRAFGERLTTLSDPAALRVATALLLLSPQIPMLFMGEEWASRRPFLYFTDYQGALAEAVRTGRQREFARFAAFADSKRRENIPDPNAEATFLASVPDFDAMHSDEGAAHYAFVARLLALRRTALMPRLEGTHALDATPCAEAAVTARWKLGDGTILRIDANLRAASCAVKEDNGGVLFALPEGVADLVSTGTLPGHAIVARSFACLP